MRCTCLLAMWSGAPNRAWSNITNCLRRSTMMTATFVPLQKNCSPGARLDGLQSFEHISEDPDGSLFGGAFTILQKVKFRYRLDGYERDWHDAGTRRQGVLHGFASQEIFISRSRKQSRQRLDRYIREVLFHSRRPVKNDRVTFVETFSWLEHQKLTSVCG